MESTKCPAVIASLDPEAATGAADLIEFDDLDTIKLPSTTPANTVVDEEIEVEIDLHDDTVEVAVELEADDIDALLSETKKG